MVELPAKEVGMADLMQWDEAKKQLAHWKSTEALLRKRCIEGLFKTPKEGTNKIDLEAGYKLKLTYAINRTVDEATLDTVRKQCLQEPSWVSLEDLIRWKPELSLSTYRTLKEDQLQVFDQCLIIKPGSHSLEIVAPTVSKSQLKRKAAQAAIDPQGEENL
jgi:hypothetical protein